jgi:hypothetical protein
MKKIIFENPDSIRFFGQTARYNDEVTVSLSACRRLPTASGREDDHVFGIVSQSKRGHSYIDSVLDDLGLRNKLVGKTAEEIRQAIKDSGVSLVGDWDKATVDDIGSLKAPNSILYQLKWSANRVRLWPKYKIVNAWERWETISGLLGLIDEVVKQIGGENYSDWLAEDRDGFLLPWSDVLQGKTQGTAKASEIELSDLESVRHRIISGESKTGEQPDEASRLADREREELEKELHLMNPQQKAAAMKKLGLNPDAGADFTRKKAAGAGFATPAEYNYATRMGDSLAHQVVDALLG